MFQSYVLSCRMMKSFFLFSLSPSFSKWHQSEPDVLKNGPGDNTMMTPGLESASGGTPHQPSDSNSKGVNEWKGKNLQHLV